MEIFGHCETERLVIEMDWVTWKTHQGVRSMGTNKFKPVPPHDMWTKILGVISTCEGNHDTVVSYDGTGVTWGFMQWTFTSGRLTQLLQYFKAVPSTKVAAGSAEAYTLFDELFVDCEGKQVFENFGFKIKEGKFVETAKGKVLNPSIDREKGLIDDICMGRVQGGTFKQQKTFALNLAQVFSDAGKSASAAAAQIEFAKLELQRSLPIKRAPLGPVQTLANVLDKTWETYIPAVFFNIWQNSPAQAYKLILAARAEAKGNIEQYAELVWRKLKNSKFANWSYAKPENTSPRIRRIAMGLKEYYGVSLPTK